MKQRFVQTELLDQLAHDFERYFVVHPPRKSLVVFDLVVQLSTFFAHGYVRLARASQSSIRECVSA